MMLRTVVGVALSQEFNRVWVTTCGVKGAICGAERCSAGWLFIHRNASKKLEVWEVSWLVSGSET